MSKTRIMLASALVVGAVVPGQLRAQTMVPAAAMLRSVAVATVNLRELAASAANVAALAAHTRPVELPRHRFPDGSTARQPVALKTMGIATVSVIGRAGAGPRSGGFTGITGAASAAANANTAFPDVEPPDQGLAVNNGEVVEIVNEAVQVFDSSGHPLSSPISAYTFLAQDATSGIGDPHVEFDASTQRWFFDTYYVNGSFNGFVLAVSNGSDPLGVYTVYHIDDDSANVPGCDGSCFGDYPQVGYDQNGYYIAADLFSNVTGRFVNAAVYALPKSQLLNAAPLTYQYFLFNDFVVEPSIPVVPGGYATGAHGTEFLMTARQIYDRSNKLRVYAITNTDAIATGGLVAHVAEVVPEAYNATVPSTQPDQVGPYGQSVGATSSPSLDGGYNSFGSGVKYLNGTLYGALTSGATDLRGLQRDVIAWFEVAASANKMTVTASISAQGYIVPPSGYSLSYPGWALDARGNGVIGTTITNPNPTVPGGYPSTGFVPVTAFMPGHIYKVTGQGGATDDGFTGYGGAGPAGVGRWGDFSSATVDPVSGLYYVANEFIPNPDAYPRTQFENWGTFITRVTPK